MQLVHHLPHHLAQLPQFFVLVPPQVNAQFIGDGSSNRPVEGTGWRM
jgi:hypothetical protein